jgi:hypothetical protein
MFLALAGYWALERSETTAVKSPTPGECDHDRNLFARYNSILGEAEVTAELNTSLEDCRTTSVFTQNVEDWCRLAKSTEGRFLSSRLQSALENYRRALVRLGQFTARNFFRPRGNPESTMLSLLPEHRHMHGEFRQMFEERSQELKQIVSDVEAYGQSFRLAVKEELHV